MAELWAVTDELQEWIDGRPPHVRAVVEQLPPNKLYLQKSTGHRVTIVSYGEELDEDMTPTGRVNLTVSVDGRFNYVAFERAVFGISPDDLEETDLPGPNEMVGAFMNDDEQLALINQIRQDNGLPPASSLEGVAKHFWTGHRRGFIA